MILTFNETDLDVIDNATLYESSTGERHRIIDRDYCPGCNRTTRVTTILHWRATFTNAHKLYGCFD